MVASRGFSLHVPLATQAGDALDVSRFGSLTLQPQGSGWSATLQVQGRLRGGPWENIGTALTIAELGDLVVITPNVEELRVDVTYASGTPLIRLFADRANA